MAKLRSQAAPKEKSISFGSVAVTVLLILYPVLVYLGLSYSKISAVAILLIVVSIGRLFVRRRGMDSLGPATIWISAVAQIDAVDIIVRLQEITKKRIRPDQFKSVRTVEDVVKAIEELVNG